MAAQVQRRILVTDDEEAIRESLSEYLSGLEYKVDTVSDAGSTLSSVADAEYNVLLLDHMLSDNTGLDIMPALLATNPALSIIVMTGYPTVDLIISAVRRGACDVVVKPFELQELSAAVARAVTRNELISRGDFNAGKAIAGDTAVGPDSGRYSRQRASSTAGN